MLRVQMLQPKMITLGKIWMILHHVAILLLRHIIPLESIYHLQYLRVFKYLLRLVMRVLFFAVLTKLWTQISFNLLKIFWMFLFVFFKLLFVVLLFSKTGFLHFFAVFSAY